MSTEVKHGPSPSFDADIRGEYSVTVVGHYTTTQDLTAGGVTAFTYGSDQAAKRLNELLGMRTIFLEWWIDQWRAGNGPENLVGKWESGRIHRLTSCCVYGRAVIWTTTSRRPAMALQNHHRDSTFGTRTDSQTGPQAVTMAATVTASQSCRRWSSPRSRRVGG
jgi:hypothetical protein